MKYSKEKLEQMMQYNNGSLDLRGTSISELPENLTVGGSLYLRETDISELPENLTIGGSLHL